jgi:signal transduction histidine kinase
MGLLGTALAWLCWQFVRQDRQLESQRVQERLEQAADRSGAALEAVAHEFDHWLDSNVTLPDGVIRLIRDERGLEIGPTGSLLYLPLATAATASADQVFTAAERLEFQARDSAAAVERLQPLATSRDQRIRAGALLRLGRNLRKLKRYDEALDVYGRLEALHDAAIEEIPAELAALEARCTVLETIGRRADLTREALRMDAGLRSGRWRLSGQAWDFYRAEAGRWVQLPPLDAGERHKLALARGAEWTIRLWPHPMEPQGRRILDVLHGPVLISWSAGESRLTAIMARPDALAAAWKRVEPGRGVRAALVDTNGTVLLGSMASNWPRAVRSPAVKGMPATLVLTLSDSAADRAGSAIRRRFLLTGFAVLALILIAGSYFILRSMARERAVARLQSEFVSAVSHEFRTPLTSMRQMSELLVRDRIAGDDERRQAYGVLLQASERLERLVESLLDFGRMEADAYRYRFEDVDPQAMVAGVVDEFRRQAGPQGFSIELTQADNLPTIRADREAIGVALWNLLDNAVKYSIDSREVWVESAQEGSGISIAVRDRGPGIEAGEQQRIFEKFARGSAALKSNIKGTGIGLSMARHIVRAHGGEIRLGSLPGKGSTFTIFLPGRSEQ